MSSVTVYPAGDPRGGIASELILESQDFGVIDSGMIVEPTPAADDQVGAEPPRVSTLSLREQEPAAAADTPSPEHPVSDATIAQALDTLLTLARDPEMRRRMREMLE